MCSYSVSFFSLLLFHKIRRKKRIGRNSFFFFLWQTFEFHKFFSVRLNGNWRISLYFTCFLGQKGFWIRIEIAWLIEVPVNFLLICYLIVGNVFIRCLTCQWESFFEIQLGFWLFIPLHLRKGAFRSMRVKNEAEEVCQTSFRNIRSVCLRCFTI